MFTGAVHDSVTPPAAAVAVSAVGALGRVTPEPVIVSAVAETGADHCVPSAAVDCTRNRYSLPGVMAVTVADVAATDDVVAAFHVVPPSSDCCTRNPAAAATASVGAFQESVTDPVPEVTVALVAASAEIARLRSRTAVTVEPSVESRSRPKPRPSSAVNTSRPPTSTRPVGDESRVDRWPVTCSALTSTTRASNPLVAEVGLSSRKSSRPSSVVAATNATAVPNRVNSAGLDSAVASSFVILRS